MNAEDQVGYALKRAQQALHTAMARALAPLDLTPAAYALLTALDAEPGLSNAQAARRSFVTPQTMHQLLQQLERRGFVARAQDPEHGRILRAAPTPAGLRVLLAAHAAVGALEHRMLDGLDPDSVATLRRLLEHIPRALRDAPDA